jgi:hypothetical protein
MRAAITSIAVAAGVGAVLAAAQVGLAEWTAITTLTDNFWAGGDRYVAQQMTLVAWFCATAATMATAVAARWFPTRRALRRILPVAAAAGTLAALPILWARANDHIGGQATIAVQIGALAGAVAGMLAVNRPVLGLGVAAHSGLVWIIALLGTAASWTGTVVYAGLVQLFDLAAIDDRLGPYLGYFVPTMLPFAVAVVILAGVLAGLLVRRGFSRSDAVRAAAVGPVLATVLYPLVGLEMWNAEAAPVVAVTALVSVLVAALVARVAAPAKPPATPDTRPAVATVRRPAGA